MIQITPKEIRVKAIDTKMLTNKFVVPVIDFNNVVII